MKIANKISLSFFTTSLILTAIAGVIFYSTAKDSLQKSIYNNLTAVLASRTDHIETYLKMLETSVGQLSRSTTLEDFLKISDKESPGRSDAFEAAMKRLARTKEANPAITEFLLMDGTGKVVASSSESSIGLDKSSDTYFLCGQKELYIKDAYYFEIHKEPLMAVSAPLLDSVTGELLGVLAARVRLSDLNKIVADRTGMGKTGEIYIVNKYGYMITSSIFIKGAPLKQRVYTQNVRRARLHKDKARVLPEDVVVGVYPDYRGVSELGTHEYIPQMQWIVVSEIDAQEAFQPLDKIRLIFLAILFIVPIAGWLLGSIFAKFIAGPINRLRKGSEIIGSGNLDYKVGTDAKDEVGQLSRAFDAMLENLKHSVVSIENLNKEITERKQAEEALLAAKDYTENIIKSMFDTLIVINPDGKIKSINKAVTVLLGYKEEELIGKPFGTIVAKEEEEEEEEGIPFIGTRLKKLIKEGSMSNYEVNFKTKDSNKILVLLSGAVMRRIDCPGEGPIAGCPEFKKKGKHCEKLQGVVVVARDITESKQAEEKLNVAYQELQQAQQELIQASKMAAMGQLAAGISHELNQPLTGIKGFTQAVLADLEKESPFRSDLNKIVEQADRIDAIIKNVRFFARKSDFNMVETDINQVILDSLMLLSQQLKVHNIRVIQELGLGIPKMQGDPNQIQQAFINIINNARDAILSLNRPEGGEIRIRTALAQDKKHIQIIFQDTGGGIPEENLENMFTPFFTTKSPDKGMGLGLSITYRIIENHQGKIDFQSKAGESTTFRIILPLKRR